MLVCHCEAVRGSPSLSQRLLCKCHWETAIRQNPIGVQRNITLLQLNQPLFFSLMPLFLLEPLKLVRCVRLLRDEELKPLPDDDDEVLLAADGGRGNDVSLDFDSPRRLLGNQCNAISG